MEFYHAIVLGLVEGLTEFLPISSTAHLLMASQFLGINDDDMLFKNFAVVVQLGSILALLALFWARFASGSAFWVKILVAFLPTGALGFLFSNLIESLLSPSVIAYPLILGGIVFIIIEITHRGRRYAISCFEEISFKQAFIIGCFQSLAMIPGVSRSGATIIGGLLLGFNRQTAAEFSFLLAFPTMVIASGYSLFKHHDFFTLDYVGILSAGMLVAFVTALVAMKALLGFIAHFSFIPFGIYRILIGIVFLFAFS
ncbi:MAG: undecaprenyl-diphosphatase UppP [Helicobacter sp.]|nr:undecaprenyl-diphosphatase UppP [Helicobacter sp.]MDE7196798.1 undecaprenyl-diphosphatase UppP [Helicobacter sp.]